MTCASQSLLAAILAWLTPRRDEGRRTNSKLYDPMRLEPVRAERPGVPRDKRTQREESQEPDHAQDRVCNDELLERQKRNDNIEGHGGS